MGLDEVSWKKNRLTVALRMALFKAFPRSVLASGRGDTPLHRAAYRGETEVVELLLAANAPVDVQNKKGRGSSVRTRLVWLLLARDRLSWDRNLHLFCAEKSFVNIVALRMALFKDSNGIWWFRHDQKEFFMGSAPLVTAVRKNSVGRGERERERRHRPGPRSRGLAAWPHGRSSDSPPLQILVPRPRPLHRGPNEGRMLRDFYAMFCQSSLVWMFVGEPNLSLCFRIFRNTFRTRTHESISRKKCKGP